MQQNSNNPIARLGIIPGKAQPDWYLIRQGQANAEDPTLAGECYAGGSKEINHDIMPGDLSFGRKCMRNAAAPPGEPNEVGIVALAGLWHPPNESLRSLEDQYYPQGVVVTECRVSDPMGNPGAADPDSGYALVKAGTISIINNGPQAFYAGQLVAWRFPPLYQEGYAAEMRQRARGGTIPGQIKPEVVPFDYTDSTLQLQGALMAQGLPQEMGGVTDMDFAEFFAPDGYSLEDAPTFSCEVETAAALKFGTAAIVLGALEYLARSGLVTINVDENGVAAGSVSKIPFDDALKNARGLAQNLGVFDVSSGSKRTTFTDMLTSVDANHRGIFASDLDKQKPANMVGRLHKGDTPERRYNKLRESGGQFVSTLAHGTWHSKSNKVLGRALSYAATSDTLHTMLGHTLI